jgi:hypothetical protein
MDDRLRRAKLAKLIETEGYESLQELFEAVIGIASPLPSRKPCRGAATSGDFRLLLTLSGRDGRL